VETPSDSPIARTLQNFAYGLTSPLKAASLLARHPRLLAASLLPWLFALGLDLWIIHKLQAGLAVWIHSHLAGTLESVAVVLGWVALVIVGALAFSFIVGIAALPLNDWLAELTEPRADPPLEPVGRVSLTQRARLLSIDLFKTCVAMGLSLLALFFSWVPVLNLAGLILTFLLITFQFLSFPQTRRGQGIAAGAKFLARNFAASLGFGMSFAFLFSLPIVSSLALPLAVVAGTLLYARGK
jgi:uncharacterized protein involved in cysteine biosynthesis